MKILKKWWFWVIVIILAIIVLIILTLKIGTPCGYSRGTSCPSNSEDCSCFGIKVNENLWGFNPIFGGGSKSFCLGKCFNCKCYEEGCPARTGYKKEVDCNSVN